MRDHYMRNRRIRSEEGSDEKCDIPVIDTHNPHRFMIKRHSKDKKFIKAFEYDKETLPIVYFTYNKDDSPDLLSSNPSYTKFKTPFDVVCQAKYMENIKKYNNQFRSEIDKLIENQSCAREAAYFVRIISYTTLWPPYHSHAELRWTSRQFYGLTNREHKRFRYIMQNDF